MSWSSIRFVILRVGLIGLGLGLVAAVGEVVWVARTIPGAGFRPVLLPFAAIIDGGLGLALGLVLGAAWGVGSHLFGHDRRPGAVPPALRPTPAAPHEPAGTILTRRAALRLGLGLVSAMGVGTVALALANGRHGQAAAQPGLAPAPGTAQAPAVNVPGRVTPNILLITLDTTRADQLHAYGNPMVQTPVLDSLAAQGARFDLHLVQQPQTNPSHASLFTGTYPATNGVRVHMVDKLPTRFDTLATVCSRAGYATAGLYSWMSFDPQYCQFQRGFDIYRNVAPNSPALLNTPAAADYRVAEEYLAIPRLLSRLTGTQRRVEETAKGRADITTDVAIAQLEAFEKDRPFFMWVHYFDAHYPYEPPDEIVDRYDSGYQGPVAPGMTTVDDVITGKLVPRGADLKHLMALYQSEITFADTHLGRLLATLDTVGMTSQTVVALMGDHGESFNEHSRAIEVPPDFFHPHGLYNTEARTPFLLRYPSRVRPGTTVAAPSQAIDIFPTLLDLAGLPIPEQSQGRSLVGLLDGRETGSDRAGYSAMSDYGLTCTAVPGWKFIRDETSGEQLLFDLSADPLEQHDLAATRSDLTGQLAAQTSAWMQAEGM